MRRNPRVKAKYQWPITNSRYWQCAARVRFYVVLFRARDCPRTVKLVKEREDNASVDLSQLNRLLYYVMP
jgi:hypothetical protein